MEIILFDPDISEDFGVIKPFFFFSFFSYYILSGKRIFVLDWNFPRRLIFITSFLSTLKRQVSAVALKFTYKLNKVCKKRTWKGIGSNVKFLGK